MTTIAAPPPHPALSPIVSDGGEGKIQVVALASGRGSNFAALLEAQQRGELPIRIRALLSDKPAAHAVNALVPTASRPKPPLPQATLGGEGWGEGAATRTSA